VRNSTDLFQSFRFDTDPVLIGLVLFQVLLNIMVYLDFYFSAYLII